ncbi:hypothetical protein QCN32_gp85 [Arthrobacter phage Niktson]|uniref:Uncharacterized protein n=1 Tax=Arthrobacter phage Niktson TaxID=2014347 RepID=A0A218M5Q8_9CAUD|nr:hypothetical protein QCN32_gp85 [Arthrobacter phage Niktson]ASD52304.1 hypothetical protein NIKTSON_85 [Arthrobacter phage Niktson]ASD52398.1 hypothetical protein ELEPHANTMAN_85 [Arthrobacter phage ElephantMan]
MGKSSPTKLQLKHIPNHMLLKLMYQFQELSTNDTVHFDDLKIWLCPPIPEKLLLRKLQTLEDKRWIESYGPASRLYRAVIR